MVGVRATAAEGGLSSSEAQAASVLGGGDAAVVSLVRELSEWRNRAMAAEAKLGVSAPDSAVSPAEAPRPRVLGSLGSERLLILSFGRSSGATQGAIVSVGDGLIAKVVESRDKVSAALVESSFKGKVSSLEGLPVRLAVR